MSRNMKFLTQIIAAFKNLVGKVVFEPEIYNIFSLRAAMTFFMTVELNEINADIQYQAMHKAGTDYTKCVKF